jgi:peptidoglycan/LPS O-acetylase OafA/YrhL
MLLTIALWLLALAVMPRYPVFEQYGTWVNAAALFFAGALVWTRRYEVPLSPWGVLAVIAIGVMTHGTPAFKTLYVVGLVYVVFVSALSIRLPRVESRDLSYGVYLYGWPAQQLAFHLVPGPHPYVNALLGATIALCIAWASWEFVERPALSFKSLVR